MLVLVLMLNECECVCRSLPIYADIVNRANDGGAAHSAGTENAATGLARDMVCHISFIMDSFRRFGASIGARWLDSAMGLHI